ncbi:MAG: MBL fold metallo-hydrolase [Candidatus Muiribacterium halophilum]|uniref:MBL fold metallo-hydrolase n=1 Tax=Muiribacterium halophilum TaxID=2053465 RepID=A0A2N5ZFM1_MUIH1|nr:MAG: MBL fold metallo-hydrolase [Candidatus Muirbacterium halophilum]
MKQFLKPVQMTEKIWWIGAIDWGIRNFHGYRTSRGTTYNAYLILDEKKVIIDSVKAPFREEMLARLSELIDPSEVDYIISNHAEPDHSGSLEFFVEKCKPEKFFASTMGQKALCDHYGDIGIEITPVKTGDSINIGENELKFIETRMLHWPDSMFTYADKEKALFCQDGFGLHLATSERFDDQLDEAIIVQEAEKYYANILTPFSVQVAKLIEGLPDLGLDIDILLNDHGPAFRTKKELVIDLYKKWSSQKPENRAVIIYDTMWGSTEKMAKAIEDGFISEGVSVKVMPLSSNDRSDVATEVLNAGAVIFGSSTLNNHLLPKVADCLTYLKGLRFKNIKYGVFGSFGWSGEACKQMTGYLEEAGYEKAVEPLRQKYVPGPECMKQCQEFGIKIAKSIK